MNRCVDLHAGEIKLEGRFGEGNGGDREAADFWMNTSKNTDFNEGCSAKCSPPRDNGCMAQFLFEHTSDAVWLIDPDTGAVVDCNEAATVLMRSTSRADLVGRRLEELAASEQVHGPPSWRLCDASPRGSKAERASSIGRRGAWTVQK